MGISILGIKLTIYYIPYYLLGYIVSKIETLFKHNDKATDKLEAIMAIMCITYVYLIYNFDFYHSGDSIKEVLYRVIASIVGSLFVCWCVYKSRNKLENEVGKVINWFGRNSLGIYLIHSLFLGVFGKQVDVSMFSMPGFGLMICNYFWTLFLSAMMVYLVEKNKYLNKILLYK